MSSPGEKFSALSLNKWRSFQILVAHRRKLIFHTWSWLFLRQLIWRQEMIITVLVMKVRHGINIFCYINSKF